MRWVREMSTSNFNEFIIDFYFSRISDSFTQSNNHDSKYSIFRVLFIDNIIKIS